MAIHSFKWWWIAFILCLIIWDETAAKAKGKRQATNWKKCKCGISNNKEKFLTRIIDGDNMNPPNKYPWMVSLMNKAGDNFCGGAIISPHVIISAAHCFVSVDYNERDTSCLSRSGNKSCLLKPNDVRVGLITQHDSLRLYSRVSKMIPHQEFQLTDAKFDIGLVIMKDPIPCKRSSRPVCLPAAPKMAKMGQIVTTAGWGTTNAVHKVKPHRLQRAKLKIISQKDCRKFMGSELLNKASICLRGIGKQSPCFGDSGSPLVLRKSGKYYCIGVASIHASSKCEKNMPMVFTDVHSYLPWIRRTMKKNKVANR